MSEKGGWFCPACKASGSTEDEHVCNVVPIRGQFMSRAEEEAWERPKLICDPETMRYSIVVAGVAVYTDLDPLGKRERIRLRATQAGPVAGSDE